MFDEDELIDPQEFEHLLYNQVYHSFVDTEPVEDILNLINDKDTMNSAGRYFHNETANMQPQTSLAGGVNAYGYALDPQNQLFSLQNRGFALPHMLVSPINNILLLQNPPTQVFINNKEPKRKRKWKKKKKKQSKTAENNQKKDIRKQVEETVEIVNLSDSNDSDVCCIEEKPPLVLLSSDDEIKTETKTGNNSEEKKLLTKASKLIDNDVVFVPTQPKEVETIVIEDETVKLKEDLLTETVPVHQTPEHIPACQKEFLGTPESTMSNDFLESTSEFMQNKFNFGLHGVDFSAKDLNKQNDKPVVERSETESSASDVSTPVKTAVFNEVPFESPTKNIFNEPNLKNFADFIVPKRVQHSTMPMGEEKRAGSVCLKTTMFSSSDSSSESDYEEVEVRKKRRLPSLCVFEECSTSRHLQDEVDCAIAPSTSTADVKKSIVNVSDSEESKVNLVGTRIGKAMIESESTIKLERKATEHADSLSSEDEGEPYRVSSSESECSSVFNMDHFVTLDEDFDNETMIKNNESSKANEQDETYSVVSSESDESLFDVNDLENLDEDLQIVNCEETAVKSHEPHDDTMQKNMYSFDAIWTNDKEKFYKDSWGHENFSITQVQKTMSDDPKLWKILDTDKERSIISSPRKQPRCRRCRDHHFTYQCPRLGQPKCVLCGIRGHLEPRCPNKICTMCGRHSNYTTTYCSMCNRDRYSLCRLCKMQGHIESRCPDLWRRYFFTTKEGPLVRPEGPEIKEARQLCCSGCAEFGHLEHACNYYNRSHPPTNPLICKYEDIYGNSRKTKRDVQMKPAEDLRNKLQNKVRKVQTDDDNFSFHVSFEKYKEGIMKSTNQQQENKLRANKESAPKASHHIVRPEPSNYENQSIVEINQQGAGQQFSFLNAAMRYFSKPKTLLNKGSTLLLNPFVMSGLQQQQQKPLPATETSTPPETTVALNGFGSDQVIAPPKAVASSKDFIPNNAKDLQFFLGNAFSRINACRRLNVVEIWDELKKEQESFSRKPAEVTHHTIRALFERLHIILFGIHRLLGGAEAVKTLSFWRRNVQKEQKWPVLPRWAMDDIKKSYDYIFGKARRDLNYQKLINIIERKIQEGNYLKRIDKDYNFFKENSDGLEYKKLHTLYGRIKARKHNDPATIKKFRKTYQAFRKSIYRNKTNQRREND